MSVIACHATMVAAALMASTATRAHVLQVIQALNANKVSSYKITWLDEGLDGQTLDLSNEFLNNGSNDTTVEGDVEVEDNFDSLHYFVIATASDAKKK